MTRSAATLFILALALLGCAAPRGPVNGSPVVFGGPPVPSPSLGAPHEREALDPGDGSQSGLSSEGSLSRPSRPSGAPLLPAAATPSPSEPQPVAATRGPSAPALDAVTRSGIGTHMGDAPVGPRYLALPIGPGHRVRLCGIAACVTVTSTDAGPDLAMQRAGRVADLSVELFELVCGCPASRGLANVSWTVVPDQHPEDPPENPDDKRMRIEDGGPG